MKKVLAIDLGGTNCRIGVAPADRPQEVQLLEAIPAPLTAAAFVNTIGWYLTQHEASALGVGIPGLARGTVCAWVPNLPYLDGLDLAAAFPDLPIGLGNDAQLSLLAEVGAGAASGLSDAVLLAIGTGIGSAVLASGTIVSGHSGSACSFGWATADLQDEGNNTSGWLERQAAGRALDALAARMGLAKGHELISAARAGNAKALALLEAPMDALGATIGSTVALLDPAAVIIAGGVADALDVLSPLLRTSIDRRLPPHLRGVPLLAGQHGSRAGLVGAAFAGALGQDWRKTS